MCFITVFKKKQINQNKENAHYATNDEGGGFFFTQNTHRNINFCLFCAPFEGSSTSIASFVT